MRIKYVGENLAYHASRILLLISKCGRPQNSKEGVLPGVRGRTLLAKLDFFLRYPAYLRDAAIIEGIHLTNEDLGLVPDNELYATESRMVRYLYGPWDEIYYPALAYLIGKGLIVIHRERGTEIFRITPMGLETMRVLSNEPAFSNMIRRAHSVYRLFNKYTGTGLKTFIYTHFPEILNKELGEKI